MPRSDGVPVERPAGDPALASAWDEGMTMTEHQAIAFALEDEGT